MIYLKLFRMLMLFSHKLSFVLLEATISGIKLGQLCGHSCLIIYCDVRGEEKERGGWGERRVEEVIPVQSICLTCSETLYLFAMRPRLSPS